MEDDRFDTLTKTLTTTARSRRQALAGLALGALAVLGGEAADARHRHQRGHHGENKHPADSNQSRCKYAGRPCAFNTNCCSKICCNKTCCDAGQVCTAGVCCTKKTCATDYPGQCGVFDNGCGGTVTCGCSGHDTCGGGGTSGVCGCTKKTCAGVPSGQCGSLSDGCGGTINCGCGTGQTCQNGTCCTKQTCAAYPGQCGAALSDGCGGTLDCHAACATGLTCAANGSCAQACPDGACPTGCDCFGAYCIVAESATCEGVLCSGDSDCPVGQVCVNCGHQFGCAPLCGS